MYLAQWNPSLPQSLYTSTSFKIPVSGSCIFIPWSLIFWMWSTLGVIIILVAFKDYFSLGKSHWWPIWSEGRVQLLGDTLFCQKTIYKIWKNSQLHWHEGSTGHHLFTAAVFICRMPFSWQKILMKCLLFMWPGGSNLWWTVYLQDQKCDKHFLDIVTTLFCLFQATSIQNTRILFHS